MVDIAWPWLGAAWRRFRIDAGLVVLAVALLAWLGSVSGQIEANGGRGWDGDSYASMLERGWDAGTASTSLRPLVVLLNRPAFLVTGDAVTAFRVMNYAWAVLLTVSLCLLFVRYNADAPARVLFVANVLVCIATLKLISYYPVLVDLGAYAVLTLGVYAIIGGRRLLTVAVCLAAVLSREFGTALVAFGAVRDLRLRVPLATMALTYAPPAIVWVGWRSIVSSRWSGRDEVRSASEFLAHLTDWQDPLFAAFFVYFLMTVYGGVSLFVAGKIGLVVQHLRREPEWGVFIAAVLAPAIVGSWDIWRYLAYLLPAFAVLFAVCARELGLPRRRLWLTAAICGATLVTQRPWQPMNLVAYFRDWFPYYVQQGTDAHNAAVPPELWPVWAWRFMMVVGILWLLAAFPAFDSRRLDANRA